MFAPESIYCLTCCGDLAVEPLVQGNDVPGTYDGDYFNGTEEDLRAYLLGSRL
jgi:hypothetical protein